MSRPSHPLDCETARTSIRGAVAGKLSHGDRRELRQHVQKCEACHEQFVASMHTLASLGHERRLHRVIQEKALRRFERKRCIEAVATPKKLSRGRLRTLLYPAFFGILMLSIAGRLPLGGGPRVLAQGPGVYVRGHELTTDAGEARIQCGEVLHTSPEGHALISVRDTVWRMRGLSAVRLEAVAHPTLRLAEGHLEFHGAGRCLTQFGIVVGEKDSLVSLFVDAEGMNIQVSHGAAKFVTALGETPLESGCRWHVDLHGVLTRS